MSPISRTRAASSGSTPAVSLVDLNTKLPRAMGSQVFRNGNTATAWPDTSPGRSMKLLCFSVNQCRFVEVLLTVQRFGLKIASYRCDRYLSYYFILHDRW